MIVALNYYRRHGIECEGKHPVTTFTGELEERRKGWARCKCPIYAIGTLNRKSKRMATKQTDWKAAADMMAPFIAANSWEAQSPAPQPPQGTQLQAVIPAPGKVTIETATRSFIKGHEKAKSAANTIRSYGFMMEKIRRFSAGLGLVYIEQWTSALVRQFQDGWDVGPLTSVKHLSNVKSFFEFCVGSEWITHNPARIKPLIVNRASKSAEDVQKFPFTDAELVQMFAGCRDYGRTTKREWPKKKKGRQIEAITEYRDYHRVWTGEDLAEFIAVSVWTGLRISDVATFHIDRLVGADQVHVRTIKGDVKLYTSVPIWLADRIRARALRVGPLIFGEHTTKDLNVITDVWRRKLKVMWEQSGPWKIHPTPHRFRHTFARIILQKGESPATVAELMGNTEAIVRKHYSAWVAERQERLSGILRKAFADMPNPFIERKALARPIKAG